MGSRRTSLAGVVVLVALLAVSFAACGDDEGGSSGGGISLSAVDNSFEPSKLEAPSSGEVTVDFTNDGDNPHTFSSEEGGFDSGTVAPGESKTVTFDAPDGEISFQCNIHGQAMSGTITPQG
jgi:plastocyanin